MPTALATSPTRARAARPALLATAAATLALSATALPAAAQQSAASASSAGNGKVVLSGVVDAAVRHTTHSGPRQSGVTRLVGGGMSQSRFMVDVTEDLGNGNTALISLEHRFNSDTGVRDSTAPFFHLSYVGLLTPYGRITAGRQWNVLFDAVSSSYASFPYSPYMDVYKPELGLALGGRVNNSLKYTFATPSRNLVGTLQHSFKEGNTTASTEDAILAGRLTPAELPARVLALGTGALKSTGAFLRYAENGVAVAGAFMRTELPGSTKVDAWTLGGSWQSGPWYVSAGYGVNKVNTPASTSTHPVEQARARIRTTIDRGILNHAWAGPTESGFQAGDANKRQMARVGFGYQITPQWNLGMHVYHAKQSGSATGHFNGSADFFVTVLDYALSKRTDTYLALDHTRIRGGAGLVLDTVSNARTRTGITAGLRHRF